MQARIVALNAQHFLKQGGNFVISVKASCIDSTATPEAVFANEVSAMQGMQLKPKEQVRKLAAHMHVPALTACARLNLDMRACAEVNCSRRCRVSAAL